MPMGFRIIRAGRAWIPAPSALLSTGFTGMKSSSNRQLINKIGITAKPAAKVGHEKYFP